jgi:SAM-dependent methyltransferase
MSSVSFRVNYNSADGGEGGGVQGFYAKHGHSYTNPHEAQLRRALRFAFDRWTHVLPRNHVLDLACGSGEVTACLEQDIGIPKVCACDPFTGDAFLARMGRALDFSWSFEDVESGVIPAETFSLCVCSYALHLADTTRLSAITTQIALVCPWLLILSPHKKPRIDLCGFDLHDSEIVYERVHIRLYRSLYV